VGFEIPMDRDSISFVPTLRNEPSKQKKHEFLYWEFHEGGFRQAALFRGRWKGIRSGSGDSSIRLFDLQNDVGESHDVSKENPEVVGAIDQYFQIARTENQNWIPQWGDTKGK
jgi:arylsulfatase A-like enzyme